MIRHHITAKKLSSTGLPSGLVLLIVMLTALQAWAQTPEPGFANDSNNLFAGDTFSELGIDDSASFLPVKEAYRPSAYFTDQQLVVIWDILPGYYLYRDKTDLEGMGKRFDIVQYSQGKEIYDDFFGQNLEVYYQQAELRVEGVNSSGIVRMRAQGCADAGLCYPPTDFWFDIDYDNKTATYHLDPPGQFIGVASTNPTPPKNSGVADNTTTISFWLALAMAFAGGLILNLMPCVFPVLAIKALKISSLSESFAVRAREGLLYTSGVLSSTLIIALALIAFRASGAQVGWGFQLQSPWVVMALTILFFIIGLSFSGWVHFGSRLAGVGQSLTEEGKPLQSFFTGVLAMVVASPCSAPFMAAALGYAVNQPTLISLLIFISLGAGVAAPMLLLYLSPALAKRLPRPGAWMETVKQFLAFPMYLTSVWLIWVLTAQIGPTGAAFTLAGLCMLGMAAWFNQLGQSTQTRTATGLALAIAITLCINAINQTAVQPNSVESEFTLARLDEKVESGHPVFVDVTADWCITCKFNESRVLNTRDIQSLMNENQVRYMVADWTNDNPEITKLLERYQRVGIPLYLFFPGGDSQPQVLPQVLTKQMIKDLF